MNVHRALQLRIGEAGIHHVEDAMDRLVAARAEDGGAQDALRLGVDDGPS